MLADPTFYKPAPVDALIGVDLFPYVLLGGNISLGTNMPTALSSIFGFILMGTSPVIARYSNNVNGINLLTITDFDVHTVVKKFWTVKNPPEKPLLSTEKEECELHLKNLIVV